MSKPDTPCLSTLRQEVTRFSVKAFVFQGDVQLKEDIFIEADSSSDHDSDNEHEDKEYEFSYEDVKKTYTEWINSLERDDSK